MTMGTAMRENGVLKLVHPGGFAEIHNKSITAAEVMKKNPRHCVTRPDVFKFPWVVVRPESILNPGRVFFIVPNHTIYRLLQAYGPQHHNRHHLKQTSWVESWDEMTPKIQEQNPCLKQKYIFNCWNEVTPKYRDRDRNLKRDSPVVYQDNDRYPKQKSVVQPWAKVTPKYQNHDEYLEQSSSADSWTEAKCKRQDQNGRLREKSPVGSRAEVISKHQDKDQCLDLQSPMETWTEIPKQQYLVKFWPEVNAKPQEYKYFNQESLADKSEFTELKSCLRKHKENGSESRGRRVTFVLPGDDDK